MSYVILHHVFLKRVAAAIHSRLTRQSFSRRQWQHWLLPVWAGHVPAELVDEQVSKRVHQHEVLGSPLETGD